MANVSIRVVGLNQTKADLRAKFENKVRQVTKELETALKNFTPVRTGRAQAGWRATSNKLSGAISNSVPYVQYLEKGTPKMRPANRGRGIIGPSLNSIKGKIK